MPIQYPGFRGDPTTRPDFSGISNLPKNVMEGIKIGMLPAHMKQQKQQQALQQALAQQRMAKDVAQTGLYEAQTKQAQTPDFSKGLPPDALMRLRIRQGSKSDDPEMQALSREWGSDLKNKQKRELESSINKSQTQTQLAKLQSEGNRIKQGFYPGTNNRIEDPETQQRLLKENSNARAKNTDQSNFTTKNALAENLEYTLDKVDIDNLAHYSGGAGRASLGMSKVGAAFGRNNPKYFKYVTDIRNLGIAAEQFRNFYASSNQKDPMSHIADMLNTTGWNIPPALVRQQFDDLREILNFEGRTYSSKLSHHPDRNSPPKANNSLASLVSSNPNVFKGH